MTHRGLMLPVGLPLQRSRRTGTRGSSTWGWAHTARSRGSRWCWRWCAAPSAESPRTPPAIRRAAHHSTSARARQVAEEALHSLHDQTHSQCGRGPGCALEAIASSGRRYHSFNCPLPRVQSAGLEYVCLSSGTSYNCHRPVVLGAGPNYDYKWSISALQGLNAPLRMTSRL